MWSISTATRVKLKTTIKPVYEATRSPVGIGSHTCIYCIYVCLFHSASPRPVSHDERPHSSHGARHFARCEPHFGMAEGPLTRAMSRKSRVIFAVPAPFSHRPANRPNRRRCRPATTERPGSMGQQAITCLTATVVMETATQRTLTAKLWSEWHRVQREGVPGPSDLMLCEPFRHLCIGFHVSSYPHYFVVEKYGLHLRNLASISMSRRIATVTNSYQHCVLSA